MTAEEFKHNAQLAAERFLWRTLAESLLAACETFISAQQVIDMSGYTDNYEDAARARRRQAEAVAEMKRILNEQAARGGRHA